MDIVLRYTWKETLDANMYRQNVNVLVSLTLKGFVRDFGKPSASHATQRRSHFSILAGDFIDAVIPRCASFCKLRSAIAALYLRRSVLPIEVSISNTIQMTNRSSSTYPLKSTSSNSSGRNDHLGYPPSFLAPSSLLIQLRRYETPKHALDIHRLKAQPLPPN